MDTFGICISKWGPFDRHHCYFTERHESYAKTVAALEISDVKVEVKFKIIHKSYIINNLCKIYEPDRNIGELKVSLDTILLFEYMAILSRM